MKKIFISLILFMFPIIVLAYNPGDSYIKGDADGDGKVTSTDYIVVRKHILKQTTLTGDALVRADATGDNKITSLDYIAIRKMILNGNTKQKVVVPGASSNVISPSNLTLSYNKKAGIYDTCATVSGIYYECTNYLNIVTTSTNATKINYVISKKTNGKYNKINENTISGNKATIKLSGDGEYEVKAYPLNSNGQKGKEITSAYAVLTDQYQHGVYSEDGIEIRVGTKGKTSFFEPNKNFTYYFKVKGKQLNNTKVTNTITSKTSGLNISKTDSVWNNKTITINDDNEHLYTGTFNVSKNGVYTITININGIVLKFDVGIMPKNKKANEKLFYFGATVQLPSIGTNKAYMIQDQNEHKSVASLMETSKYMGLNIVRDGSNWVHVQPNLDKEEYTFERTDRTMNIMKKYDFNVLWTLLDNRKKAFAFYSSKNLKYYKKYMEQFAKRYAKNNNVIWEVWNEPDLKQYFGVYGRDANGNMTEPIEWGTKDDYINILKTASQEIKKVNPKAIVTAGGLALYCCEVVPHDQSRRAWNGDTIFSDYKKLLADGIIDTYDIHDHRVWGTGSLNSFWDEINCFNDNISKVGLSSKGVFVTESGSFNGSAQASSLANKALWYRSHGYKMFIQYSFINYHNRSDMNKEIFNIYLEPKDAAITYSTVIRFLGQAKLTNGISSNKSLFATIYYDEAKNQSIIPVYSILNNGEKGKSLVIPSGAKVYDMYGNLKSIRGNTIQSTNEQVYVVISGKVGKDKFKVQ